LIRAGVKLTTFEKSTDLSQRQRLERFAGTVNKWGANFAICDTKGVVMRLWEGGGFASDRERLRQLSLRTAGSADRRCMWDKPGTNQGRQVLGVALPLGAGRGQLVAVVDLGRDVESGATDSGRQEDTGSHSKKHRAGGKVRTAEYFEELMTLCAESFEASADAQEQIEMVSTELAQVYEELVLLHKLSTNMKVTESDANFLQMACDNLTDIVPVEGIAVLVEKVIEDERHLVLAAGSGLIDINEDLGAIIKSRLTGEMNKGREALLDSEVDGPFRYEWQGNVNSIIAVPLCGKGKARLGAVERSQTDGGMTGLMVAINRVDKPDFDSIDAKLFNSVANSCAVFVENGELFRDLKELFIGSLRALTNAVDAKDRYTRGHSERVAFISRWIAEQISQREELSEDQIHKIYLAGLLHDIGKVGINEAVLNKKGRLTRWEVEHIRKHPLIGASILREIRQMQDIVPGVLSHHERVDGKGYPHGLSGEQIPLMGRILGLADSFDAMTSKRIYREAMSVEEAMAEIEQGLGQQFDEKVGRIFLDSDVDYLWQVLRDGLYETFGTGTIRQYGTVAVGTLVR